MAALRPRPTLAEGDAEVDAPRGDRVELEGVLGDRAGAARFPATGTLRALLLLSAAFFLLSGVFVFLSVLFLFLATAFGVGFLATAFDFLPLDTATKVTKNI